MSPSSRLAAPVQSGRCPLPGSRTAGCRRSEARMGAQSRPGEAAQLRDRARKDVEIEEVVVRSQHVQVRGRRPWIFLDVCAVGAGLDERLVAAGGRASQSSASMARCPRWATRPPWHSPHATVWPSSRRRFPRWLPDCRGNTGRGRCSRGSRGNSGRLIVALSPGCTYTLTAAENNWYGPNGLPAIASDITI